MQNTRTKLNAIKTDFSGAYNEPLPDLYYSLMRSLEYQIPENAKPIISFLLSKLQHRNDVPVNVLDLGCSYGVLSALIKHDLPLNSLYNRFKNSRRGQESVLSDKAWFSKLPKRKNIIFYGIDISENAIHYATTVGLLEAGTAVNLESSEHDYSVLAVIPQQLDLVVSTGCVGYITDITFSKILNHVGNHSKPIFVSFVLRAFDFEKISDMFQSFGYVTHQVTSQTFVQRKFSNKFEQDRIISLLKSRARSDLNGFLPETGGYYHAELFLSFHKDIDPTLLSEIR